VLGECVVCTVLSISMSCHQHPQAISSLAEAAYDNVDIPDDAIDDQPDTYCLSSLYSALMSKVLDATQRFVCVRC